MKSGYTSPSGQSNTIKVRRPAVAGTFYPGTKDELQQVVDTLIKKAKTTPLPAPLACIAPHAGYVFSGKAAAEVFANLDKEKIKRVIILGPSHYAFFKGIAVSLYDAYETPLGTIPVDQETSQELLKSNLFIQSRSAEIQEHSIEVELPLLQSVLPDLEIIPLVVGELSLADCQQAAKVLAPFIDEETLIVVSSDFMHYGPNYGYVPFDKDIPNNIKKMDTAAIEHILKLETEEFISYQKETGITICGRNPICLLMETLKEIKYTQKGTLVEYYTSGDVIGDFQNSVSYAAIAFPRQESGDLSQEEKKTLLSLARSCLSSYLKEGKKPNLKPEELTDKLNTPSGVFVTLTQQGELRGCIGYIEPIKPLWEAVIDNAINAATSDFRFQPVTLKELDSITIEISALTPTQKISSLEEFVIGTHGIILEKNGHRAVFLPQVAVEQGWDKEQTLTHLCLKAGLSPNAYKEGASFEVFRAEVFHED